MDAENTLPENLAGQFSCHDTETAQPQTSSDLDGFIGTSPVMLSLYETIQNTARSSAPVFITGESGTGKEVCAHAIHRISIRSEKPFVPINCAAIPRDLLESELFGHVRGAFTGAISDRPGAVRQADGGTLFLDEIGEMDPGMQTKLLRFLQDGSFQSVGANTLNHADVRVICATNRDPLHEIKSGRFREDLFYRLHVLPITMPPLRARGDDILDIAQTLLLTYAKEEGKRFRTLSPDTESLLRHYDWPGNIRQLQNVIRNAVVMHDGITLVTDMLPAGMLHSGPTAMQTHPMHLGHLDGSLGHKITERALPTKIIPLDQVEREAIETAITACSGNIPRAAALLGVSPSTIYRKKSLWESGESSRHPSAN